MPTKLAAGLFHRIGVRLRRTRVRGTLEYLLFPGHADLSGGPFNGQRFRQTIFCDLVGACRFEAIIETGTFRGSTTLFMATKAPGVPVYTVEADPVFYGFAARRLRKLPTVKLSHGDSRAFLRSLPLAGQQRAFFYLDAHWNEDLPLAEEARIIFQRFANFVIMIDDFEVPGEPDYGFDHYGAGERLSLRDFPFDRQPGLSVYFPNRSAALESGSRRGCIVLASAAMEPLVNRVSSLRRGEG